MSKYPIAEQLTLFLQKTIKEYPIISFSIIVLLGVLLFLASIKAGESIGDAIWK